MTPTQAPALVGIPLPNDEGIPRYSAPGSHGTVLCRTRCVFRSCPHSFVSTPPPVFLRQRGACASVLRWPFYTVFWLFRGSRVIMTDIDLSTFSVIYNLWQVPWCCAVCDRIQEPVLGFELCLLTSCNLVCRSCGVLYAPELLSMLTRWERAARREAIVTHRSWKLTPSA